MLLSVFVVLCPVLKRLQCFWPCPIITIQQLWDGVKGFCQLLLLCSTLLESTGLAWTLLGKHLFSVWQLLAAFMCSFLPCIKMGSDNLLKIHTSISTSSHSVLITDGPKLQNLDPELNILLLWYVRCKVLPSLRKKKEKEKKSKRKAKGVFSFWIS